MASGQAAGPSLFVTLDAKAVMDQMKASPFLLAQQQRADAAARSESPTRRVPATGTTPVPPTPAGTASLSPAASLATLMSGLTLQSAAGPASPAYSSSHASLADAMDSCFSVDALAGSGSDLSHAGSMELPPALQALLQQQAQQRTGHAISLAEPARAGTSSLLSSGTLSAPASPPRPEERQRSAFSGFAAASAAGSQALPLEVQAYLQQQQQQQEEEQQRSAAAVAVAAAAVAAQEQQAALGWTPAGSDTAQGAEGYTGGNADQTWAAASPGMAAFQSAIYGWGGQPLPAEQAAAAAGAPYGTLPQALFSLQLPQRLQLQALLAQQQQLLQQQQQQAYVCGAGFCPPGMPQPSTYALRRAAQAPQDPPETLLGPHGRYQPYCKQFITPELNNAAQHVLCTVKMLQCIDGSRASRRDSKRFFCSLKEVSKVVGDARCLIVAPDVQPSSTAAINPVRALQRILNDAQCFGVPVVFALSRRGIGQVFGRDKAMSIVALMRLDGLEPHMSSMMEAAAQGRLAYLNRRDATVLPLETRLLGATSSANLAPAQSLPSPQAVLGGAMPQWLQTLQEQALGTAASLPAALPSLPSMPSVPSGW
ncbi:selenocysteine insertion sequence-binding 2 [Chlorella sorokiniana]|uniref:Selenocysteine insertion sequence-binding 2 n=1 Tax=Chlorella sorokiniana TaxID=3076 RepID=A0A2P6TN88_CHLSO|nr:selenocysteine insertion sequence-binding 2 [Chlorella sorokiniana]|eukprot:PRW50797.1 selenocysteine insertion sequence-binding 2 [Chlorella sorokiniana]